MTFGSLAPACSFSEETRVLGSPEPPAGCWCRTAAEPCPGESGVPAPCWCPRRPPPCSAVGQRGTAHGKSEAAKWPKAPSEASDGSPRRGTWELLHAVPVGQTKAFQAGTADRRVTKGHRAAPARDRDSQPRCDRTRSAPAARHGASRPGKQVADPQRRFRFPQDRRLGEVRGKGTRYLG